MRARKYLRACAAVLAFAARAAAAATPDDIGRTAESYLGVPYNWGGTSKEGFDCSGFVGKVYAQNGYALPRVSHQQARVGLVVPEFALQKGDLLFFTRGQGSGPINHVALYMQDSAFIHASVGSNAIRFDTLQSRYFKNRFAGARRILGMPPGRYATLAGTAPEGVLFNDPTDQTRFASLSAEARARVVGASPAEGPLPALEGEHSAESRPIQIAAEPSVAIVVNEVGPTRLDHGRTGVALAAGYLLIGGDNFAVFQPVFRYVGEATSVRVDLALPWAVPWDSQGKNPMAWGPWAAARTWGRVVRTLGIGQENANLEVHLDRTWSATLGSGQLLRNMTPNIGVTGLADAVVEQSALTFAGSATLENVGLQWMIDDVFSPSVMGLRAWVGPAFGAVSSHGVWGATRLSLNWAGDLFAPGRGPGALGLVDRQVHGFGATLETPWYKSAASKFSSMLDASTLLHPGAHGWGLAGGLLWEAQGIGTAELRGHLHLEVRAAQGAFVPGYFDVLYKAGRIFAPVQPTPALAAGDTAPTRLDWLDSLSGAPWHWSLAAEARMQVFHRATVGLAYEDGESLTTGAGTYTPRSLMLFMRLDPVFADPSGQGSGLYLAYHLRNADAWGDAGWRSYVYATVRHDLNAYLGLQAAVRRGLQSRTLQVETDFMTTLTLNYDL